MTAVTLKATALRRCRPLPEQEKLQQHCGCARMTSYVLSDGHGELPHPLSPVAMGRRWRQDTYFAYFAVLLATFFIKPLL